MTTSVANRLAYNSCQILDEPFLIFKLLLPHVVQKLSKL